MNFDKRKVLVPPYDADGRRQASMTMARWVPWGIPEPTGIHMSVLGRYLGVDPKTLWRWTETLGIRRYYGPAKMNPRKKLRSRSQLISEEDVARVIVHARSRLGRLRESLAGRASSRGAGGSTP